MSAVIRRKSKKVGTSAKSARNSGVKKDGTPKKLTKKQEKKIIKDLEEDLRKICSRITSIRWGGRCGVCGLAGTAAHHYFGTGACSTLRFTIDNLVWLCFTCHIVDYHRRGITEPVRRAMVGKIGEDRFEELYRLAFRPKKDPTIEELTRLKEALSIQLENLGSAT